MQRATNIFTSIVMFVGIVLFVLLMGVKVIGITPYVVTSGSMTPEYPVGSVVYVKPEECRELQAGDDITFYMGEGSVATHRVKENDVERQEIETYGINNRDSDGDIIEDAEKIKYENVIGKVHYSIPYLGWIYFGIHSEKGKIILISIAAVLLLILPVLTRILQKKGKQQ